MGFFPDSSFFPDQDDYLNDWQNLWEVEDFCLNRPCWVDKPVMTEIPMICDLFCENKYIQLLAKV